MWCFSAATIVAVTCHLVMQLCPALFGGFPTPNPGFSLVTTQAYVHAAVHRKQSDAFLVFFAGGSCNIVDLCHGVNVWENVLPLKAFSHVLSFHWWI